MLFHELFSIFAWIIVIALGCYWIPLTLYCFVIRPIRLAILWVAGPQKRYTDEWWRGFDNETVKQSIAFWVATPIGIGLLWFLFKNYAKTPGSDLEHMYAVFHCSVPFLIIISMCTWLKLITRYIWYRRSLSLEA